jgi:hypothetical protein
MSSTMVAGGSFDNSFSSGQRSPEPARVSDRADARPDRIGIDITHRGDAPLVVELSQFDAGGQGGSGERDGQRVAPSEC